MALTSDQNSAAELHPIVVWYTVCDQHSLIGSLQPCVWDTITGQRDTAALVHCFQSVNQGQEHSGYVFTGIPFLLNNTYCVGICVYN